MCNYCSAFFFGPLCDISVRTATTTFIVNLSVSDLLFCCVILPLATSTYLHRDWIYGDALCTLFPLLRYGLVAVSLFSVVFITVNRYVLITHPRLYSKLFSSYAIAGMVAFTWLGSFGALLPTLLGQWGEFGLDRAIGSCSIVPKEGSTPKVFLFVSAFLLPCLLILACYARIFFIARRTSQRTRQHANRITSSAVTPTELSSANHPPSISGPSYSLHTKNDESSDGHTPRRGAMLASAATIAKRSRIHGVMLQHRLSSADRRLLKMILVIFTSFVICYLPITIVKMLKLEGDHQIFNVLAYLLIYLSPCMNPLIYVAMSAEYRQAYSHLLRCSSTYETQYSHRSRSEVPRDLGG